MANNDGGLDSCLYDNRINKGNLNSLLSEFKKNNFVAFLGTGVGSALRDIPSYEELYQELCKKHGLITIEKGINPTSFSNLFEKSKNKEDFDSGIFEIVEPKKTSGTMTTYHIADAFDCYVTTNYYDPIEKIFETVHKNKDKDIKLKIYFFTFPALLNYPMNNTLTYLHGHREVGFCILRQKDYEFLYPSLHDGHSGVYALENSLTYIFTKKTVVFLGCSLESHLRDFMKYLISKDQLNSSNDKSVNYHYWLVSDDVIKNFLRDVPKEQWKENEQKFFENFHQIRIKPIIYSSDHIFIEKLCQNLVDIEKPELSRGIPEDISKI